MTENQPMPAETRGLSAEEREWIANALSDAFTPYGRDFDPEEGARLIEARMETLLARVRAEAGRATAATAWDEGWQQGAWDVEENGWESHDLSKGPHPANPYRSESAICPRQHDETHSHVTPSGKRVCIPCRQLRKKRKEDRRRQSWPFVEMLPAETGYNLGHHRTRPGDEHVTGEGCHCLPDRIPHDGTRVIPPGKGEAL